MESPCLASNGSKRLFQILMKLLVLPNGSLHKFCGDTEFRHSGGNGGFIGCKTTLIGLIQFIGRWTLVFHIIILTGHYMRNWGLSTGNYGSPFFVNWAELTKISIVRYLFTRPYFEKKLMHAAHNSAGNSSALPLSIEFAVSWCSIFSAIQQAHISSVDISRYNTSLFRLNFFFKTVLTTSRMSFSW